jgi:hypothetical protein
MSRRSSKVCTPNGGEHITIVLLPKSFISCDLLSNQFMSFSKVCITLVLSTAAVSMQAAGTSSKSRSHKNIVAAAKQGSAAAQVDAASGTSADQLSQVEMPVTFSCYVYPAGSQIAASNSNGLVCPALQHGDGVAKPGWLREFRCSVSGTTATCAPLENPGPATLADLAMPVTIYFPSI